MKKFLKKPSKKRLPKKVNQKKTFSFMSAISEEILIGSLIAFFLLLGIIGTILINQYTKSDPAPYSTLGFPQPDDLPNKVRLGGTYLFDYEVKSKEHQETAYNITTTFELYRLYDVTEGLYSCLSPYRRKVYMEWTNETNLTHITTKNSTFIPDLAMLPDRNNPINWTDQHTLTFDAGKHMGNGTLIIYYEHLPTNQTLYEITIDAASGDVFFNGEWKNNVTLHRQNDKGKLAYLNGVLTFTYNNVEVFSEQVSIKPESQFGFESRDVFFFIGGPKLQHVPIIDVPDKENLWEYVIGTNRYYDILFGLQKSVAKEVTLNRFYEEIHLEKPTTALNTSTLIDSSNAGMNIITGNVVSSSVHDIFDVLKNEVVATNRAHFMLRPRILNDSVIPWDDALLNITFPKPEMNASHNIVFGTDLAIKITNETVTVIDIKLADRPSFPLNFSENNELEFFITTNATHITFNGLSFKNNNRTLQFFQDNTYQVPSIVKITHNAPACFKEDVFDFCFITLAPTVTRVPVSTPSLDNYGHIDTIRETVEEQDHVVEVIPSQKAALTGRLAAITNQTNYSLSTHARFLDGQGLMAISLDEGEINIVNVTLDVLNETVTYKGVTNKTNTVNLKDNWFSFEVSVKSDILQVRVNNSVVFEDVLPPIGLNATRFFTHIIEDSHFETSSLQIQKDRRRTNIPQVDDPCRLRLIHKETLRDESFSLHPEQNITFSDSFTLKKFFDYGKVSVDLDGSSGMNNTALHTHFWLVRS